MFLYDSNKHLVAADKKSVEELGFESTERFFEEVEDIAEFFAQKPGYIYQFKNFSWIDFVIFNPNKEHRVFLQPLEVDRRIDVKELVGRDGESFYLVTFGSSELIHQNDNEVLLSGAQEDMSEESIDEINIGSQSKVSDEKLTMELALEIDEDKPFDKSEEVLDTIPLSLDLGVEEEVQKSFEAPKSVEIEEVGEKIDLVIEPLIEEINEDRLEIFAPQDKKEIKSYDIAKVAQELEIDTQLVKELLVEFIDQVYKLRPKIYESIKQQDLKEAKELIHKIKGASANLRIALLDEILFSTHGEENFDQLEKIMDRFYEELPRFVAGLEDQGFTFSIENIEPEAPETVDDNAPKLEIVELQETTKEQTSSSSAESRESPAISKETILAQAKEELGLESEDIEELIREYLFRTLNSLDIIEKAIKERKSDEIARIIHQLKGSALNLRLTLLVSLFDDLMELKEDAFERFKESVTELGRLFGVEYTEDLSPQKLAQNAQDIGLDEASYKEFIQEFVEEILQLEKKGLSTQNIKKLRSVAKNLRLGSLALYLESMLEDSKNKESYYQKIVEIVNAYKEGR